VPVNAICPGGPLRYLVSQARHMPPHAGPGATFEFYLTDCLFRSIVPWSMPGERRGRGRIVAGYDGRRLGSGTRGGAFSSTRGEARGSEPAAGVASCHRRCHGGSVRAVRPPAGVNNAGPQGRAQTAHAAAVPLTPGEWHVNAQKEHSQRPSQSRGHGPGPRAGATAPARAVATSMKFTFRGTGTPARTPGAPR
jgi:hypothetical protein